MNLSWIIIRQWRDKEIPLWSSVSERRQSAIDSALGSFGNPGDDWAKLKAQGFRITRLTWSLDPSRMRKQ